MFLFSESYFRFTNKRWKSANLRTFLFLLLWIACPNLYKPMTPTHFSCKQYSIRVSVAFRHTYQGFIQFLSVLLQWPMGIFMWAFHQAKVKKHVTFFCRSKSTWLSSAVQKARDILLMFTFWFSGSLMQPSSLVNRPWQWIKKGFLPDYRVVESQNLL